MTELRLALGMRGGVSLAVWIGGACAEIDELRRAGLDDVDPGPFWGPLLAASDYDEVVVDVLTGASAGGLNGVVFATAIRHGFPMVGLKDVWLRLGGVDRLRRSEEPWLSLFDGDARFLDQVHEELAARVQAASADPACDSEPEVESEPETQSETGPESDPGPGHAIDLQLSATLVEPLVVDAPTIDEEAQRRQRWSSRFHFRHDPKGVLGRGDLEADDGSLWRLAVAARATSSFPGAFEAALVRSTRRADGSIAPSPLPVPLEPRQTDDDVPGRRVDCRGVFGERRGSGDGRGALLHPDDFVVSDGGIVDNIPLGKAIEAIQRSPADGPTRRVLVYLHPTGPVTSRPAPAGEAEKDAALRRRGTKAVITGLVGAYVEGEDISGDIVQLEAHNAAVERSRALRRSAFAVAVDEEDPAVDLQARAAMALRGYGEQRAAADAAALRALLDDPLGVLGHDPFPHQEGVPEERWRAPLATEGWRPHRERLDAELFDVFRAAIPTTWDSLDVARTVLTGGGLGPLRRTILRAIEVLVAAEQVALDAEPSADQASSLGTAKASLYRLLAVVDLLAWVRRLGWVRRAQRPPDDEVAGWARDAVRTLDGALAVSGATWTALWGEGDPAGREAAVARFLDAAWARSGGEEPDPGVVGKEDLRRCILQAVVDVLAGLTLPALGLSDPARSLRDALVGRTEEGPILSGVYLAVSLAALEVVTLAEVLTGATTASAIEWRRMSAAAPTPLAPRFMRLYRESGRLGLPSWDVSPDRWLHPSVKLAGNELGNFSAFLRRTWRANDWLWGRLDAVPTLVDLLLVSDRPVPKEVTTFAEVAEDADRTVVRDALVEKRQRQILCEELGVDDVALDDRLASYDVGLETVHTPGDADIQRSVADLAVVAVNVAAHAGGSGVERHAGLLGRVARLVAGWWARPRPRSEVDTEAGTEGDTGTSADAPERWWKRPLGVALGLVLAALAVTVVWGLVVDRTAYLLGLVPGLVVGLGLVLAVLVLVTREPVPVPRRDPGEDEREPDGVT